MTIRPPIAIPDPEYAIRDYNGLIRALTHRKHDLGLKNLDVDERGDLPGGYFGKLCCGQRTASIVSLGKALFALDCALVLVPIEERDGRRTPAWLPEKPIELNQLDRRGKDKRKVAFGKLGQMKAFHLQTPAKRRRNAQLAGRASALARKLRREAANQGE